MFTPTITRHRKALRRAICQLQPGKDPKEVFALMCLPTEPVIPFLSLEKPCEIASVPAAALEDLFSLYGCKDAVINEPQFVRFMNDDFPSYETPKAKYQISDKQSFILSKFLGGIRNKTGSTIAERWNYALSRNPPNASNTTLKISALCRIYSEMVLPFSVSEFIDSLFAFFGEKCEEITFNQFGELFGKIN